MPDQPAPETSTAPRLVVLDVNETLSDLSPLREAFADVGLEPDGSEAWFAGVLRDGFALTVLGDNPAFAELGADGVRARVRAAHPERGQQAVDEAADRVLSTFTSLAPHPDVVEGLRALASLGCRIVTLSNGSAGVARALLGETGAGPVIEDYLSVEQAGVWKPAAAAYRYALEQTGIEARQAMLVAVHPWDVEGARRAGLRTAWVNRTDAVYPSFLTPPELDVASLTDLAARFG